MIAAPVDVYLKHPRTETGVVAIDSNVAKTGHDASFPVPNLAMISSIQPIAQGSQVSKSQSEIPSRLEWTPKLETKFKRLAQSKALGQLNLASSVEFEKLSAIRRNLKNPRTGEEVIAEYEQRMLTRDLVQVLAKYVNWHKQYSTNRQG